jgi:hypothetical protein
MNAVLLIVCDWSWIKNKWWNDLKIMKEQRRPCNNELSCVELMPHTPPAATRTNAINVDKKLRANENWHKIICLAMEMQKHCTRASVEKRAKVSTTIAFSFKHYVSNVYVFSVLMDKCLLISSIASKTWLTNNHRYIYSIISEKKVPDSGKGQWVLQQCVIVIPGQSSFTCFYYISR